MFKSRAVITQLYKEYMNKQVGMFTPVSGFNVFTQLQIVKPYDITVSNRYIHRSWHDLSENDKKMFNDIAKDNGYVNY